MPGQGQIPMRSVRVPRYRERTDEIFPMSKVWGAITSRDVVVGRQAVFTTFEGAKLIGVLEDGPKTVAARHLHIRLEDGLWGRADDLVTLIREERSDWRR